MFFYSLGKCFLDVPNFWFHITLTDIQLIWILIICLKFKMKNPLFCLNILLCLLHLLCINTMWMSIRLTIKTLYTSTTLLTVCTFFLWFFVYLTFCRKSHGMIINDFDMGGKYGTRHMDIHSTLIRKSLKKALLTTDTTYWFLCIITTRITYALYVIVSIAISVIL